MILFSIFLFWFEVLFWLSLFSLKCDWLSGKAKRKAGRQWTTEKIDPLIEYQRAKERLSLYKNSLETLPFLVGEYKFYFSERHSHLFSIPWVDLFSFHDDFYRSLEWRKKIFSFPWLQSDVPTSSVCFLSLSEDERIKNGGKDGERDFQRKSSSTLTSLLEWILALHQEKQGENNQVEYFAKRRFCK